MNDIMTVVLFDFGGVVADEGFHDGLLEIGRRNGIEPEAFFRAVDRIIADCGYLTGHAGEETFWDAVRRETGIAEPDRDLRREVLRRFVIRPGVLGLVDQVRESGATAAMLSDQTNWLEEIAAATGLFRHFDAVFNSFRTGKSKRDASVFTDVCAALGAPPASVLFVDDNLGHVERARSRGLQALLFTTESDLVRSFRDILPLLRPASGRGSFSKGAAGSP